MKNYYLWTIITHLIIALIINFGLKFLVFTVDNIEVQLVKGIEFVAVYFVLLSCVYVKRYSNIFLALKVKPLETSFLLLQLGLKAQKDESK